MLRCRAAWRLLTRTTARRLPPTVVQRRLMSSVPGGSGENVVYTLLCGGAFVGAVTYAYSTVSTDHARFNDRTLEIQARPRKDWELKPWPPKNRDEEEEDTGEEEVDENNEAVEEDTGGEVEREEAEIAPEDALEDVENVDPTEGLLTSIEEEQPIPNAVIEESESNGMSATSSNEPAVVEDMAPPGNINDEPLISARAVAEKLSGHVTESAQVEVTSAEVTPVITQVVAESGGAPIQVLPSEKAFTPVEASSTEEALTLMEVAPAEDMHLSLMVAPVEEAPVPVVVTPSEAPKLQEIAPAEEATVAGVVAPAEEPPKTVVDAPTEENPAPQEVAPAEEALAAGQVAPPTEPQVLQKVAPAEEISTPVDVEHAEEFSIQDNDTQIKVAMDEEGLEIAQDGLSHSVVNPFNLPSEKTPLDEADVTTAVKEEEEVPKREYVVVVLEGAHESEKRPKVLGVGPLTGRVIPAPEDASETEANSAE